MHDSNKTGSIVCVGTGMTVGAHIAPIARSHIENADIVFFAGHPLMEMWVTEMNSNLHSLQVFYAEGKDRRITYKEMVNAMMTEVRAGKKVVGAFYGHPGVFALPPHNVIKIAKKEGYAAHMVPGISAEDCLYADLGVDPGKVGSQHFEASQFMFYQRQVDPSAYLILWQVGIAGDKSAAKFSTGKAYRQILVELLNENYPNEHKVALYECPTVAIREPRIEWITLGDFIEAELSLITTMLIPPSQKLLKNQSIIDRLALLEKNAH
ncbi:SAM-dependent methyltransferase [Paraglaciecola sp. MB-3u-78]|jgi:uncharacterized protein YabN with tetrapyrrole methylase and pyrophosphatase domain|uniref:SAM-dependent methyltransferase n=1 Tax=Paraglaciecola sp. MB-3u-78 TaxID=2058332 RepID=UPI000C346274|nr:SAM-dependent methyltransferase [Paraglaciecola sp. MB-3u-78]PKG99068.1 hypothetical protein CXF95_07130 [Paraglaciecola sp. MB-3u-78]